MNFQARLQPPTPQQVLQDPQRFVWCGSAVRDPEGRYHLFASVWPKRRGFLAWVTDSTIVRAEAEQPEGPYRIVEGLEVLHTQPWASRMTHNPVVLEIAGRYYLYYTGTTFTGPTTDPDPSHPGSPEPTRVEARYNQRIGVAVAEHPRGPWVPFEGNPVLRPRPSGWDSTFVTNPSVFVRPDGRVNLIYKSRLPEEEKLILGLAVAPAPTGPFEREGPSPLLSHDIEDPCVWFEHGQWWMLAKDMGGGLVGHANTALFHSPDARRWSPHQPPLGLDRTVQFLGEPPTGFPHVERPQILLEGGRPVCLYNAVGDFETFAFNLARRII